MTQVTQEEERALLQSLKSPTSYRIRGPLNTERTKDIERLVNFLGQRISEQAERTEYWIKEAAQLKKQLQNKEEDIRALLDRLNQREAETADLLRGGDYAALLAPVPFDEISIRTANCIMNANCFQNANIEYVYELAEKTEADLLRMKHFGRKSVNEVKEILAEMGLSLGMKLGPNFPRVREIREGLCMEVVGLVSKDSARWHDSVPTLLDNWFQWNCFRYVFELVVFSREDLLRKKGMGAVMLDRVEAALAQRLGFSLGMTLEDAFYDELPEEIQGNRVIRRPLPT